MSKRNVTLADLAERTGVSKATVSLVMRDSSQVSDATKQRVLQAADDLGYVYNRAAASLRSKTTGTVGLIVTTVANPFFAEVVDGIESRISETGSSLILTQHSESLAMQRRQIEVMLQSRVDGVIITPAYNTPWPDVARLMEAGVSTLLLTRRMPDLRASYVGSDNVAGARAATEHLIEHGCTRIAFVGGAQGMSPQREREDGVLAAIARTAGAASITSHPGPTSQGAAYAVVRELLSGVEVPDAIVAYNDLIALGAHAAIADAGLVVGRDVRLIGFDDVAFCNFVRPSITSVNSRPSLIGSIAAETLTRMIADGGVEETVLVPNSLSIRESCGCGGELGVPE